MVVIYCDAYLDFLRSGNRRFIIVNLMKLKSVISALLRRFKPDAVF